MSVANTTATGETTSRWYAEAVCDHWLFEHQIRFILAQQDVIDAQIDMMEMFSSLTGM